MNDIERIEAEIRAACIIGKPTGRLEDELFRAKMRRLFRLWKEAK